MRPVAASIAQRPQAVQATSQSVSAFSPLRRFLQATQSRWLTGGSENRPFGQIANQSPHAVHFASFTAGSPSASIRIASNLQTRMQSDRPRQPQVQPLPPPDTTAAARQDSTPA